MKQTNTTACVPERLDWEEGLKEQRRLQEEAQKERQSTEELLKKALEPAELETA